MLEKLNLSKVLFLDIEAVSVEANFESLSPKWQNLWERKSSFFKSNEEESAESLYHRAGIYAEFGKIICISIGFIHEEGKKRSFRIKSFCQDNERQLLEAFSSLLNQKFAHPDYLLCAHNGKEFDFPFIARRMLVNKIKLPYILDIAGRKPWEVQHLDTMHLWKFGDYKYYTSLEVLSNLFDIPSPKSDMDGSMVNEVYYKEHDLEKIRKYCEQDTLAVAQILLSYKGKSLIKKTEIVHVNE